MFLAVHSVDTDPNKNIDTSGLHAIKISNAYLSPQVQAQRLNEYI